jgi:hypothetical protein
MSSGGGVTMKRRIRSVGSSRGSGSGISIRISSSSAITAAWRNTESEIPAIAAPSVEISAWGSFLAARTCWKNTATVPTVTTP